MLYNKMVQSIIDINEDEDRILNIVKAQFGFKNKSQAVAMIVKIYADSFMESELRPEYIGKLKRLEKEGNFIKFNSIEELRKSIENA
ncbi:MAG: DUF2683 family protein [Nanoarchaeota archaeon]|nr:DUF2683 family protein [Nanoarchaeota archaeon]